MAKFLDMSNLRPAALGVVGFVGGKWLHEKIAEPALSGVLPGLSQQDKDLIFNALGILVVAPIIDNTIRNRDVTVGYLIWNGARAIKNLLARLNIEKYFTLPVEIPF